MRGLNSSHFRAEAGRPVGRAASTRRGSPRQSPGPRGRPGDRSDHRLTGLSRPGSATDLAHPGRSARITPTTTLTPGSPAVKYYAHSGPTKAVNGDLPDGQPLADHLRGVAVLAAGLLHDLGKYRLEFQRYIRDLPHGRTPSSGLSCR